MSEINETKTSVNKRYITVTDLMEMYSLSRVTVLKWVKDEDANIRYFQDGRFLRVNLEDFENYVSKKVDHSMKNNKKNK